MRLIILTFFLLTGCDLCNGWPALSDRRPNMCIVESEAAVGADELDAALTEIDDLFVEYSSRNHADLLKIQEANTIEFSFRTGNIVYEGVRASGLCLSHPLGYKIKIKMVDNTPWQHTVAHEMLHVYYGIKAGHLRGVFQVDCYDRWQAGELSDEEAHKCSMDSIEQKIKAKLL